MRGLAYGLDPYSTYLTAEQVRQYRPSEERAQAGIGAELSQVASYLYVIAPVKRGPAEQAGVLAGDIIEYIDNKATRDISLYDARQLLNGAPGQRSSCASLARRDATSGACGTSADGPDSGGVARLEAAVSA